MTDEQRMLIKHMVNLEKSGMRPSDAILLLMPQDSWPGRAGYLYGMVRELAVEHEAFAEQAIYIERLKTLVVDVKLALESGKAQKATDIILDFMVKDR